MTNYHLHKKNHTLFTVLISVYWNEKPHFLNEAFRSIHKNTLSPDEIIVVEDGLLSEELDVTIAGWEKTLNIVRVPLPENIGLGLALNEGLKKCKNEIIIRADTDDINDENRFFEIVNFLDANPDIDIVGSWVEEFSVVPGDKKTIRKVPGKSCLLKYSKYRSPFNHPSVAFRKNIIEECNGYSDKYLYEDYALWMTAIARGAKIDNIQKTLVYMRTTNDFYSRRGGWKYMISDVKWQYEFFKKGYIGFLRFLANVAVRIPARIVPNFIRKIVYIRLLR